MKISDFEIGKNHRTLIVAELSANHKQDFDIALKTVRAAKEAGADAIKFQTYTPDTITLNSDNECFRINKGTIWDGMTLYKLYEQAYMPWDWQPKLKQAAEELGLICFSSPFDKTAVDFLVTMNVPAFKVASFEITDVPLIQYTASRMKPVILSTGIAMAEEIKEAIDACRQAGNNDIILLQCTSAYPAPVEFAHLSAIPEMKRTYGLPVGLSDHTLGATVAIAAVSLGACLVEKHFILDRKIGGPDSEFSMEPGEFRAMSESIRQVEKALGPVTDKFEAARGKSRYFCRSLFAVKDIKVGEPLTEENIRSIRPGIGLPPKYLGQILGKKAGTAIKKGTPLQWGFFQK